MAKERINPQFDMQRVVQPIASPVDIYYRPNMVAPDTTRQLQIVRALQDLNPQLQRLTSDAMSMMIERESQAGQMEAMTLPEEVLRRKATEWIEKSGGVAPWRYQSALETAGARLVRDKYQSKLYAQLDSLSEPFNADGTVRNPNEVTAAMDAAYTDAGIPAGSFFMQRGATAAKTQIDEAVMQKVNAMRLEKVKAKASTDLMDSVFAELNVTPGEDLTDKLNGQIKVLMDQYYAQGYGSGDDVLVKAFDARIDVEIARKNYDQSRYLVTYLMENGIAGRKIGGAYTKQLQDKLEAIDKAEESDDERDYARADRADNRVITAAGRLAFTRLQEMKMANNGYLNLTLDQAREMASKEILPAIKDATDDQKARLMGVITDAVMTTQLQVNTPGPGNPRLARELKKLAQVDPDAAEKQATDARMAGDLDQRDWEQVLAVVDTSKSYPPEVTEQINGSSAGLRGVSWTNMDPSTIDPALRGKFAAAGNDASELLEDRIRAYADDPKFRELMVSNRRAAMSQLREYTRSETKKIQADLQAQFYSDMEVADVTAASGAVLAGLEKERGIGAAALIRKLGVTEESEDYETIVLTVNAAVDSELNALVSSLATIPNMAGRRAAAAAQLPKIIQQLGAEMKNNPKKYFGTSLSNTIGTSQAQAISNLGKPSPAAPAEVQLRPGQVAGEAVSPNTWSIFSQRAMSGREATVGRTAQEVSSLNTEITVNPSAEQQAKFNDAKRRLGNDAVDALGELTGGMTLSEYLGSPNTTAGLEAARQALELRKDPSLKAAAFEVRPDGIYALDGDNWRTGQKIRNDAVTNKYWVYKSLTGYSPKEITSGKTKEGLDITPPFMDPNSLLFFRSKEEFANADREYQESGGESGYIADTLLPTLQKAGYAISYGDLVAAQAKLIRLRLPID